MARGITFRRYAIEQANHYHLRGFRVRIEVASVCGGMDPNIFVYRREPANPVTGVQWDTFQTIASFPDMEEYPIGTPNSETPFPYFRSDSIELDLRSVEDVDYVWQLVLTEAAHLINALDKAEQLVAIETATVGEDCADSESASISESA